MTRARDVANVLSTATALATDTETAAAISSHNSATTSVHGITNTATLATQTYADSAVSTHAAAADPHLVYLKESEYNAAGKNFVINGLFDIWQRSTDVTNSLSMGTFYAAADRWQNWVGTSCNTRYQRISNADPGVSQYSYRIQRVAGVTTATNYQFSQNIETSIAKLLVGKTVTLSFRVKKGANWSDADGTMSARVAYNDNTDGNVINQVTTTAFSNTFTPTTSFATYSITGTIPSSGVSTIMVNFFWEPTGTAGADDWLEFSAVQLEIGSTATPFSRAGGTLQGELAACKRYFERNISTSTQGYAPFATGFFNFATAANYAYKYEVEKRVQPTITFGPSTNQFMAAYKGNAGSAASTITAANISRHGCYITLVPSGTPFTPGESTILQDGGSAVAYIDVAAEM